MATGFTSYDCEIMEGTEWVVLFTTQDPVEAYRWLDKAKADGMTATVTERD